MIAGIVQIDSLREGWCPAQPRVRCLTYGLQADFQQPLLRSTAGDAPRVGHIPLYSRPLLCSSCRGLVDICQVHARFLRSRALSVQQPGRKVHNSGRPTERQAHGTYRPQPRVSDAHWGRFADAAGLASAKLTIMFEPDTRTRSVRVLKLASSKC